jgi:hypothetical protein
MPGLSQVGVTERNQNDEDRMKSASAERASERAAERARLIRAVPQRNTEFDHLDLEGLRGYRTALSAEEGRVSYWRRIMQARIDVVRATAEGSPAVDNLRDVLADVRVTSDRNALVAMVGDTDAELLELPDLSSLWCREVDNNDPVAVQALILALEEAEGQLSEYRNALHRRISAATTELIARYREEPTLCLVALPRPPEQRAPLGV